MPLSNKTQEQINSLSLKGGPSGVTLSKVQTCDDVGNLIISLGGSGADMLLETKGMINLSCASDGDKHTPPLVWAIGPSIRTRSTRTRNRIR